MRKETFQFAEKNGAALYADFYPSTMQNARTIIYFHGGGLMYGSRDDLNEQYKKQFLEAGYNLLTVDYRLAPETKLPEIYTDIQDAILWFCTNFNQYLKLTQSEFALFGRSSGAFLALIAASDPSLPHPFALLSFYGYSTLQNDWLTTENIFYNQYPKISDKLKQAMIRSETVVTAPVEQRFPLYVYARQSGKWLEMAIGEPPSPTTLETFSLNPAFDFHFLPPLFLAHSFADQDIPIAESEKLAQGTLENEFYTVHDLPHDFDTKTIEKEGRLAYQNAIRFLDRQC